MFDRKPKQPDASESEKKNMSVETIPTAFYGGNDPVIYHEPETVAAPAVAAPVPARLIAQPPMQQQQQPMQQPNNNKKFVLIVLVLLVAVAAGASWYYLMGPGKVVPEVAIVPTPPVIVAPPAPIVEEPEPVIVEPTPIIPETPVSLTTMPIDFPKVMLSDAVDQDADGLTDSEEELFGTDSGIWDSDKDGYYDGQELTNLYNPKGFAPVKLVDSGLVKEYLNPTWQYRLYYPASWETGNVDPENNQVLISAIGGDYIEIRAIKKSETETFFAWFGKTASTEIITDLQQNKNRFEEGFWARRDGLVGYIEQPTVVYVILYHPKTDGPVEHRQVMSMLLQSFRPSKTAVVLPEQMILPKPIVPDQPLVETPAAGEGDVTTSTTL